MASIKLHGNNSFTRLMKQLQDRGLVVQFHTFNTVTKTGRFFIELDKAAAEKFLELNIINNRNLNRNKQRLMVDDMNNGHWVYTGDPIRFNINGKLYDSQNRLYAFLKSIMQKLNIDVIYNMPLEAFDYTDAGKPRDLASRANFHGIRRHVQQFLTIASVIYNAQRQKLYDNNKRELPSHDFRTFYLKHKDQIQDLADKALAAYDKAKIEPSFNGLLTRTEFVMFFGLFASISNWQKANDFLYRVLTGVNVNSGSPAHLLYNSLFVTRGDNNKEKRRLNQNQLTRMTVRAFVAFKDNLTLDSLTTDMPLPTLTPFR